MRISDWSSDVCSSELDDRGGLEIDRDRAVGRAKGGREDLRGDRRDHAVAPRDPRTHRNEGEHVEALVADREPGALEEGPARPENDGGREQHLNPVARLATDILLEARKMAAHFERADGKGERESDQEASPQIAIFFDEAR